ncbi:DUF1566 domain-containing protein [Desulfogranum mediterraneum]|uniref:DUF1566 domain-containing protein n=1 Tax=Desulfogranum mediterraneum TaxID=160661 RepID=UPI0003F855BE|nr:DUF1566 domain-containing protein [Desulfogranum mediterraneum]
MTTTARRSWFQTMTAMTVLAALALSCLLLCSAATALGAARSLVERSPGVFAETRGGLNWQQQRSKKMESPAEVSRYLRELNQGAHQDWRLPDKEELFGLFSIFDLKQNNTIKIRLEGNYWLKDDRGKASVGTWEIGDQCGPSRSFYRGKAGYVRAVRP